ncbi:MAG: hypothetical protein WD294_12155 [Phycisphaeraceae bacterium]
MKDLECFRGPFVDSTDAHRQVFCIRATSHTIAAIAAMKGDTVLETLATVSKTGCEGGCEPSPTYSKMAGMTTANSPYAIRMNGGPTHHGASRSMANTSSSRRSDSDFRRGIGKPQSYHDYR